MIQTTTKKIYFIEYSPHAERVVNVEKSPMIRVTIDTGQMAIGSKATKALGIEGKFIKLFYDSGKRTIGFTVHNELSDEQIASKKYKFMKFNESKSCTTSVMGIVRTFIGLKSNKYKCEVKKYVEPGTQLERSRTYYYVQLEDEVPAPTLNGVPQNV